MSVREIAVLALVLTSLWLGSCAHSVRSANWADSIYAHADAFALGANIPLLRNGDSPDVRVWVYNVLYGEIEGRVSAADGAADYTLSWDLDDSGQMTVTRRATRRIRQISSPESLSGLLTELLTLDGQNWGCAVDGVGVIVDGVVDRRRFVFAAGNPDLCGDERSRLAVRAVNEAGPSGWRALVMER